MIDPLSTFRLDDKVVIVTGASSGLGERFDYNPNAGPVNDFDAFDRGATLGSYVHDADWFRALFPPRANTNEQDRVTEIKAGEEIFSFVSNGAPLGPKTNGNIADRGGVFRRSSTSTNRSCWPLLVPPAPPAFLVCSISLRRGTASA